MSDLNQNKVLFLVIQDEVQLYPSGCEQYIPCVHELQGTESIITANYIPPLDPACVNGFEQAGTVASDATAATQVLCAKIKVPNRGFVWINNANYIANIDGCSACCIS